MKTSCKFFRRYRNNRFILFAFVLLVMCRLCHAKSKSKGKDDEGQDMYDNSKNADFYRCKFYSEEFKTHFDLSALIVSK